MHRLSLECDIAVEFCSNYGPDVDVRYWLFVSQLADLQTTHVLTVKCGVGRPIHSSVPKD